MRYCFNWSLTGSTIIEAASLPEAQNRFDSMTEGDLRELGDSDFTQDDVLVESMPGCFDVSVHTEDS